MRDEAAVLNAMKNAGKAACPVCDGTRHLPLLTLQNVPVMSNYLYASREEAIHAPLHEIELCCCLHCTHIHNIRFVPERLAYRPGYDNSLWFSPHYREYATAQAQRLIDTYGLRNCRVIDIGCGRGEFLQLLHRLGGCTGTGYDPSLAPGEEQIRPHDDLHLRAGTFPENHAEPADLYISRHVLEHLDKPVLFLHNIRKSMHAADPILFLEVPAGEYLLRTGSVWDIIYEHCSIFTGLSVSYLLQHSGFSVKRLRSEFGGQYLTLDARTAGGSTYAAPPRKDQATKEAIITLAEEFAGKCTRRLERAESMITEVKKTGEKIAVWGAGSKGISFLNLLGGPADIRYVVDINPGKQEKYTPGSGRKIVPPEFLAVDKPDIIYIANAVYENEIRERIRQLDLSPRLICM